MEGLQYGIQQGFNPLQQYGGSQFNPWQTGQQGQFGQLQFGQPQYGQPGTFGANAPLGGLIGSGITGLMNAQNIGRQPGQVIDGISAMYQPYGNQLLGNQPYNNIDPMTAAHLQQAQLTQQLHLAQLAHQAQLAQQAQIAQQLAQQQQFGRFGLDPVSQAIAQQRAQFGQQGWLGVNPMNRIDPVTAAYLQQAQIAQLSQQLALQGQLGQQGQFGQQQLPVGQAGHGHFGQGQFGQGQLGFGQLGQGGQNLWANPQLAAQYGRAQPFQYGLMGAGGYGGGQLPIY